MQCGTPTYNEGEVARAAGVPGRNVTVSAGRTVRIATVKPSLSILVSRILLALATGLNSTACQRNLVCRTKSASCKLSILPSLSRWCREPRNHQSYFVLSGASFLQCQAPSIIRRLVGHPSRQYHRPRQVQKPVPSLHLGGCKSSNSIPSHLPFTYGR